MQGVMGVEWMSFVLYKSDSPIPLLFICLSEVLKVSVFGLHIVFFQCCLLAEVAFTLPKLYLYMWLI